MAGLTGGSDRRGQLIVVAAIGLAILLVAVAFTLNTAVFANIHTAQTDTGVQEERGVVHYQHSIERAMGDVLVSINTATEYETLESDLDDGVATWHRSARSEYLRDGVATEVALTDVRYETTVVQNETRKFTTRDGSDTNWTVVETVPEVREFVVELSGDDLVETDLCEGNDGCAGIEITDGNGDIWQLAAYDDGGVTVTVVSPSGTTTDFAADSPVEIDVSNGTIDDGTTVQEFTPFSDEMDAPYTVRYTNPDNASGTYTLTVDGKIVDDTIEADDRYSVDGSPRIEADVASADLDVRYRSSALTYETVIQIRRGERDD